MSWEDVLPAYFACLSATTEPGEHAQIVKAVVDDFVRHDRDKYMRKARGIGTKEHERLLR